MCGNGSAKPLQNAQSTEAQTGALNKLYLVCRDLMFDNTNRQAVIS